MRRQAGHQLNPQRARTYRLSERWAGLQLNPQRTRTHGLGEGQAGAGRASAGPRGRFCQSSNHIRFLFKTGPPRPVPSVAF